MEEEPKYGSITVGVGTSERRVLEITEFIQADFKDHRTISIGKLEDDTYIFGVENPKSTGRADQATIWLSKESAVGMITTAIVYFTAKGIDFKSLLAESLSTDEIQLQWSDNLHTEIQNIGLIKP